jgi:D-3-phosphoglycerate dehydrogenase
VKYVCLDQYSLPGADFTIEQKILNKYGIECVIANARTDEEIIAVAKDADAVGTVYNQITPAIMDQLPKCRVFVRYGIGYDNINVPAATERGIVVCNLPRYCLRDVATHAIALLLDICRKTTYLDKTVRRGEWNGNAGWPIHRIDDLTIGLLGFGNIARQTRKYLSGFDCKVIAYDPFLPEDVFTAANAEKVEMDELFARADVISIHLPLNDATRHLINKDSIAKMKDGVIIINTARGPIVCQDDLVAALKSGKVCAAGCDVLEKEPLTDLTEEIFTLDNLIINPHSAFNSYEAEIEQHESVAQSVIEVLLNKVVPYNAVNKQTVTPKPW